MVCAASARRLPPGIGLSTEDGCDGCEIEALGFDQPYASGGALAWRSDGSPDDGIVGVLNPFFWFTSKNRAKSNCFEYTPIKKVMLLSLGRNWQIAVLYSYFLELHKIKIRHRVQTEIHR